MGVSGIGVRKQLHTVTPRSGKKRGRGYHDACCAFSCVNDAQALWRPKGQSTPSQFPSLILNWTPGQQNDLANTLYASSSDLNMNTCSPHLLDVAWVETTELYWDKQEVDREAVSWCAGLYDASSTLSCTNKYKSVGGCTSWKLLFGHLNVHFQCHFHLYHSLFPIAFLLHSSVLRLRHITVSLFTRLSYTRPALAPFHLDPLTEKHHRPALPVANMAALAAATASSRRFGVRHANPYQSSYAHHKAVASASGGRHPRDNDDSNNAHEDAKTKPSPRKRVVVAVSLLFRDTLYGRDCIERDNVTYITTSKR